jgi:hypothetical protein
MDSRLEDFRNSFFSPNPADPEVDLTLSPTSLHFRVDKRIDDF